jgi:hypothetical protein
MDYLAILKSLDSGKGEAANGKPALVEQSDEIDELYEKSPFQPTCPGTERCAGCYSVGLLDGRERFIHPPRASAEWEAWLRKWEPKGGTQ